MPVFEVEIRGSKYQIDAPDEAQAATQTLKLSQQPQHFAFDGSNIPGYDPATGQVHDPYGESWTGQLTSGANEGLAGMLGTPVDLANAAIGLGMKGINAVAGTDMQPSQMPFGGSEFFKKSMGPGIRPPTDDPGKQFGRRVAQSTGAAVLPALGAAATAAAPVSEALGIIGSGVGGGTAAATSQKVFPGNKSAETIAELVGSLGTGAATTYLRKLSADKAATAAVPTQQKLEEQASSLYDDAEKNGVTATQPQTQSLASDMRKIATDEGLISPTGRISEAYPKAKEAIRLMDDYSNGSMTVPQMKTVRKVLSDAAKSADGSEGRMASIMLDKFDEFVNPLAPQIQQANQLWHAAKNTERLQTASELAASRAGQFSGSGYENALRTEYRGLERNIIKGTEKGWSDAEQQAISKVAQGTTGSNIARNVGRMAPTGPVSFMASAGVPFAIGNALGGPAIGAGAATAASALGYGARGIATKMGINAANQAELLSRSGGAAIPSGGVDMDALKRLLLAIGVTNAGSQ